ncbi:MAG: chromophore lyase CpcT/CpeT [Pseudomonadota bacterium]
MNAKLVVTLFSLACTACGGDASDTPSGDTDKLLALMSGSFSSAQQAQDDESYFDIRLEMVPIWTGRDDGPWLYVEQAAASRLDEPYRQRVYRLSVDEAGRYVSTVYEFPNAPDHAGAWKEARPLANLSPADLTERTGCAVYLDAGADGFSGSTRESECLSSLRGATYATSEVDISADMIRSWDRGFDGDGNQVWGAEKGPYLFRRTGT